ncbi:hypothetical protein E4U19_001343 [Claviceps sp. Clav32 group G5]|nr:hypothetical protein E4U19_001343 [Claviceps sp. Clav32 group G5]
MNIEEYEERLQRNTTSSEVAPMMTTFSSSEDAFSDVDTVEVFLEYGSKVASAAGSMSRRIDDIVPGSVIDDFWILVATFVDT